ncbi:MAG: DUF2834 domain-containing protein [Chloroflexi bacterium]|nr:DUF2834 domain-containing protein [Chloroflexota bacterium]
MAQMTKKQVVYLLLALSGAVGTWYFNLQMADLSQFFVLMWETPVSSSITVDVMVASFTFIMWMVPEGKRLGMSPWLIVGLLVLTWLIAFAFTFPLFMFFRERTLLAKQG